MSWEPATPRRDEPESPIMKMTNTAAILNSLPERRATRAARGEVDAAEEIATMLRKVTDAHFNGATHLDMRALLLDASELLAKVGG